MRIASLAAFKRHLNDAAPDHLAPSYLIQTKDSLEASLALKYVEEAFFLSAPQKTAAHITKLDAEAVSSERLFREFESGELFSPRRLLILQGAEKPSKAIVEAIDLYLSRPSSTLSLIVIAKALPKTTNFYKMLEKKGVVFEPLEGKEQQQQLIGWVEGHAALAGKKITAQTAALLIQNCGGEFYTVYNELEKLISYKGAEEQISEADVSLLVPFDPVQSIWQLAELIHAKKGAAAYSIVHQMVKEESHFFPFSRMLRNQLQTLAQIASIISHGKSVEEVQVYLPQLRGPFLSKTISLARQCGFPWLKKAILKIDEIELKAKNGTSNHFLLIDLLLLNLLA